MNRKIKWWNIGFVSFTLFFVCLVVFLGCEKKSNPGRKASVSDPSDYLKIVNAMKDCDRKFFSALAEVEDRATADHMLKCLADAIAEYDRIMKKHEHLPALEMPESMKYVMLLEDSQDFSRGDRVVPDDPIPAEMLNAVETYMAKTLEVIMRFGFVEKTLRPSQKGDATH